MLSFFNRVRILCTSSLHPQMENADKDDPSGIGSSGEGPSHMSLYHSLSRVVTL